MVPLLLLLPLLCGGALQEFPGYELRVQESVVVQACMDVRVPCSFSYPWPPRYPPYSSAEPFIYWFREGDRQSDDAVATNDRTKQVKSETRGRFRLLGDPSNNNCSLSIQEARLSDSGIYYLRVERGRNLKYNYRAKKLNLQVTEKPDIQFLEPLESGRRTPLTCSLSLVCDWPHPLLFSWAGDALDAMNPDTLHSSALTLTPRPQDHGTNLTCRVTLQGAQVTLERTVQLNVSYAPRNLRISLSFRNITEGQALQLLCVADSNPPAQLSWFQVSPTLEAAPISSTGVLELRYSETTEAELSCRAQNPLGSQNSSLSLFVFSPPQLLGPSCSQEDEGLHCSCSSQAQPAPSLRWRLGEGLLEGNFSNASFKVTSSSAGPWANSSLSLHEGLSSGLSLSCEALNIHGARSGSVLLLPGLKRLSRKFCKEAGGQETESWERDHPLAVFPAGKPAFLVAGALGGAGAMALLCLFLCLLFFFILKSRRKQAAMRPEGVEDEDPVMGTVAWGSRQKPCPDSPPDQMVLSPAEDAPPPGEQEELHYASLNFHEMTSREPQDQEATSTEYSEIKTSQ
ncbi:sialic acid-binding Ig-like lectin 5 isoform X1 [Ovis aries]|uniref:sialic acid-binding Ig-like lectin 5 isoform X1 n=1 Tax=Ovis aries TaxID=9940 RepID=UPI00295280FA|nr:sialic acid-binding Ig-like lectin 5 isoform X1 [Ovis aries]